MWRKGNIFALLVGMQIGAATVKSSMEIPQKIKNETGLDPAITLLEIYPKKLKILTQKNICTSVFTVALCIIKSQDLEAAQVPIRR